MKVPTFAVFRMPVGCSLPVPLMTAASTAMLTLAARSAATRPSMLGIGLQLQQAAISVYAPTVRGVSASWAKVWLPSVIAVVSSASQYAVAPTVCFGMVTLPIRPDRRVAPIWKATVRFCNSVMNEMLFVATRYPPVPLTSASRFITARSAGPGFHIRAPVGIVNTSGGAAPRSPGGAGRRRPR